MLVDRRLNDGCTSMPGNPATYTTSACTNSCPASKKYSATYHLFYTCIPCFVTASLPVVTFDEDSAGVVVAA